MQQIILYFRQLTLQRINMKFMFRLILNFNQIIKAAPLNSDKEPIINQLFYPTECSPWGLYSTNHNGLSSLEIRLVFWKKNHRKQKKLENVLKWENFLNKNRKLSFPVFQNSLGIMDGMKQIFGIRGKRKTKKDLV